MAKISGFYIDITKHNLKYPENLKNNYYVATAKSPVKGCLLFISKKNHVNDSTKFSDSFIITTEDIFQILKNKCANCTYLITDNPRYYFAKIIDDHKDQFFDNSSNFITQDGNIVIHKTAEIGEGVILEPFTFIGANIKLNKNVLIKTGAKIIENTVIGENSIIRQNTIIGGSGFGITKDPQGNNFHIPHIGGVIIGSNVEIGAQNTVCAGTIYPTTIGDFVKTDDHVHIAHNNIIGSNSIITAGVIFSGSVELGKEVWIGPNSSIRESLLLEDKVVVGIGSVITKNCSKNLTYCGNPAMEFSEYLKLRQKWK